MGINDFRKIIDEVSPYTDRVTLHLMGEPLLHPHFAEIVEILNNSSLLVELTTNAILLKKHQVLILQSMAIRQVNFSLQSYIDNFPGKPLDVYLAPIFDFTQAAQIQRPDLFINFRLWSLAAGVAIPQDTSRVSNSLGFAIPQDLVALLQLFSRSFNKKLPEFIDVLAQKSWKLTDKVRIHWDTRFDWPSLDDAIANINGFCYGLKSQIGIHADGIVVPCCLDKEAKINLGNILDIPLVDILDTPRAKSILSFFQQGKVYEELCQKCKFKDRFKNKIRVKQ